MYHYVFEILYPLLSYFSILEGKKIFYGKEFKSLNEHSNFEQYSPNCGIDSKLVRKKPSNTCPDIFRIMFENNDTKLHIRQDDISFTRYCLQINHDLTYEALVCEKEQPEYNQR